MGRKPPTAGMASSAHSGNSPTRHSRSTRSTARTGNSRTNTPLKASTGAHTSTIRTPSNQGSPPASRSATTAAAHTSKPLAALRNNGFRGSRASRYRPSHHATPNVAADTHTTQGAYCPAARLRVVTKTPYMPFYQWISA